jgi:hypothetical protein
MLSIFLNSICYQLVKKLEIYYLQYNYLFTQFMVIGFVASLHTDQQMAPRSASEKVRPKKSYFTSACEYVKLPFSLRVPKKFFLSFINYLLFFKFTLFCVHLNLFSFFATSTPEYSCHHFFPSFPLISCINSSKCFDCGF